MNIFKILANGHGTVNENNISAFLGHLLDPTGSHSISHEFLNLFLEDTLNEYEDKLVFTNYEFKIFFEQEFRESEKQKKEVVDIVIVCYTTNNSKKKKTSVKDFLENKKIIHKIILIENKINSGAKNINQLKRQYDSTMDELKKMQIDKFNVDDVYSIYVTPESDAFNNEFENFKNTINKNSKHIYWKKNTENENTSIKEILKNILKKESKAKIEAINEYTKHTLKSFIQFIDTDFKSEKEEKSERKNDGEYSKPFIKLNIESKIKEKLSKLKEDLCVLDPKLEKIESEVDLKDVMSPSLYFNINNLRIQLYAGTKKRDSIKLVFKTNKNLKDKSKKSLIRLAKKLDSVIKMPDNKYDSYFRYDELNNSILLNNTNEILSYVLKAKKIIQEII